MVYCFPSHGAYLDVLAELFTQVKLFPVDEPLMNPGDCRGIAQKEKQAIK